MMTMSPLMSLRSSLLNGKRSTKPSLSSRDIKKFPGIGMVMSAGESFPFCMFCHFTFREQR